MMFAPALATRSDVNRLTRQISVNDARQAKAIQAQGKSITQLKSAQSSAIKSLTTQQLKNTKDLTKRISQGDARLDKRISKELVAQKKAVRKHDAQVLHELQHRQQRSLWNSVLIASSIPMFAAYGDRAYGDNANPFTKKNLILTGSLAGWLFADDIMDRVLARGGKVGKTWRRGSNIWNILAPFGNAATVYFFMKDLQHERFVTGVTTVVYGTPTEVKLLERIGEDYHSDFKKITSPRAVATIRTLLGDGADSTGVTAAVNSEGVLTLTLVGGTAGSAEVAWAVDTLDPDAQRSSSTISS
jgi:hypothetical protein